MAAQGSSGGAGWRGAVNRWTDFNAPVALFYDGKCSFCIRSITALRRLDVLQRIEWNDMHAAEVRAAHPDLDLERGASEMLVRTTAGEWLGGFDAFRAVACHLPLTALFWPLLFVPPVPWCGRRIYRRIAANRYCLLPSAKSSPTAAASSPGR